MGMRSPPELVVVAVAVAAVAAGCDGCERRERGSSAGARAVAAAALARPRWPAVAPRDKLPVAVAVELGPHRVRCRIPEGWRVRRYERGLIARLDLAPIAPDQAGAIAVFSEARLAARSSPREELEARLALAVRQWAAGAVERQVVVSQAPAAVGAGRWRARLAIEGTGLRAVHELAVDVGAGGADKVVCSAELSAAAHAATPALAGWCERLEVVEAAGAAAADAAGLGEVYSMDGRWLRIPTPTGWNVDGFDGSTLRFGRDDAALEVAVTCGAPCERDAFLDHIAAEAEAALGTLGSGGGFVEPLMERSPGVWVYRAEREMDGPSPVRLGLGAVFADDDRYLACRVRLGPRARALAAAAAGFCWSLVGLTRPPDQPL
jgi:hypothetical protein